MATDIAGSDIASSVHNTWLPETEEVYTRLLARAERDGWVQIRNTHTDPKPSRYRYMIVVTENGPVIHHALFIQRAEKKLMGVCQFSEDARGPQVSAHGGATATVHDTVTGALSSRVLGTATATASLTVNYKRPTPLRSPILIEAHVDKIEGKKIFLKSYMKSPDGGTVYSDCTVLYVNIENQLRAAEKKSNSSL
ncbi:acyl-coenzyme A thioesterase THEM4-like [Acanthaster planci]|uniref:Acyl-coenzyme A thioesterase THEM4 n=1 Tax=Acanthaster planci TaxID=133434 RepID=A0A8B8A0B7_ACAPL|nr:acyl-coenzyme A thioesterase THEM4-like [Acanthaster planci]